MRYCIVLSDDVAMLKRRIEAIKNDFIAQSSTICNTKIFWGDELAAQFWESFSAVQLDVSRDFIVLRKADVLKAEDWANLTSMIARLREDAFLVLCIESAWGEKGPKVPAYISGQKCYTHAKNKKWYFQEAPLTDDRKKDYIAQGIKARNIEMSRPVMDLLGELLSPPSALIDNALDQLAMIAEDRALEEKDLEHISASAPEMILFDYVKNLESGKSYPLWATVLHEHKPDDILFPLIGIFAREARNLWKISANEDVKLPSFILEKKRAVANKLGKAGIATLFSLLSDADWSIKSGKKDSRQVLDELIFRLSLLYKVQK